MGRAGLKGGGGGGALLSYPLSLSPHSQVLTSCNSMDPFWHYFTFIFKRTFDANTINMTSSALLKSSTAFWLVFS